MPAWHSITTCGKYINTNSQHGGVWPAWRIIRQYDANWGVMRTERLFHLNVELINHICLSSQGSLISKFVFFLSPPPPLHTKHLLMLYCVLLHPFLWNWIRITFMCYYRIVPIKGVNQKVSSRLRSAELKCSSMLAEQAWQWHASSFLLFFVLYRLPLCFFKVDKLS